MGTTLSVIARLESGKAHRPCAPLRESLLLLEPAL
ncbi:hypothetical protein DLNHIDIE_00001 [Acidithiobacillus thiooxidans ATCC 19377]|uniref:Uncharacterized protein n=1 Tax=Acidithiobacillus thiooxidans ATCC 19377 TaxID=637390 RepID=A0A543Q1G3_ACITH|nr:hypothetical protein DLNHIDIE_00001 [Acidithiobacillus thiooxidans ATCC 19377]